MLDDDALHAERDGLVDHVCLERCVLAAVQHAQVDAERLGLSFDAGEIGLEEVTGREIAHQRDLHAGLVERRRTVRRKGATLHQQRRAREAKCGLPQKSSCDAHVVFLRCSVQCPGRNYLLPLPERAKVKTRAITRTAPLTKSCV